MSTFSEIEQLFSKPLTQIAEELNYPEATICVLSGEEPELRTKYPDIYKNVLSCRHHMDARTPMQYAMDLAASWVMEDYIIEQLRSYDLSVSRAGEDRERLLLAGAKVSSNSDCIVEHNGHQCKLELMNDYKGYWNRYKKMDLRDDKYQKLKNERSLFLGISTKDKKYLLLNFAKEIDANFTSFHFAYNKPAYSIKITPLMLKDLDFAAIVKAIIKELE